MSAYDNLTRKMLQALVAERNGRLVTRYGKLLPKRELIRVLRGDDAIRASQHRSLRSLQVDANYDVRRSVTLVLQMAIFVALERPDTHGLVNGNALIGLGLMEPAGRLINYESKQLRLSLGISRAEAFAQCSQAANIAIIVSLLALSLLA